MNTMTKLAMLIGSAGLTLTAPSAQALVYDFAMSGPLDATWAIDTAVAPFASDAMGVTYAQVGGVFPGGGGSGSDIDFFSAPYGGGLRIVDFDNGTELGWFRGATLYQQGATGVTFSTGRFTLVPSGGGESAILTIGTGAPAVPEPATWVMAISGFGLIGMALRSRRRRAAAVRFV